MKNITAATLEVLRRVDTPTVCNAIELAQARRGFDHFTKGTMLAAKPDMPAICGYARTARIRAKQPPTESVEVLKNRRMDYYRYMAGSPSPAVCVIEDLDFPECIGAYWGEINTAVHKGFGIDGAVTNGVMRDLGDLEEGFQVIAGSIGPSHGFVHVVDIDMPVSIFGLKVSPGEFLHADRHGALVIPDEVLPEIAAAIDSLIDCESLILGPAREKGFSFEKFEEAWSNFESART